MSALGRVAKLGELYDARSDKFVSISLFKNLLRNNSIIATSNKETNLKFVVEKSLNDKFKALDVSASLQLSVMSGMFELGGSGHYLKNTKTSAKSARGSLVQTFSTVYEEISITEEDLMTFINMDILQQIDATHVVIGIQWGGHVMVSVEDANNEGEDKRVIEGQLSIQMKKMSSILSLSGEGKVNITDSERNELNKFDFEIYGDVLPKTVPLTLIDAMEFMKNSPMNILEANDGKGKEIKYKLIPTSLLRKMWKINFATNMLMNEISEETVGKCTQLFDYMNSVEQRLNDLASDVQQYGAYLNSEKIEKIKNLQSNYNAHQTRIKESLAKHLLSVRSGEETVDKLDELLLQSANDSYSPDKVSDQLDQLSILENEISFLKLLTKMNVTLLDKNKRFQQFLWENFDKDIYVMYYKYDQEEDLDEIMNQFRHMIENRTVLGTNILFASINIDILKKDPEVYYETKISFYRKGKCLTDKYQFGDNTGHNQNTLMSFDIQQKPKGNKISSLMKSVDEKQTIVNEQQEVIDAFKDLLSSNKL